MPDIFTLYFNPEGRINRALYIFGIVSLKIFLLCTLYFFIYVGGLLGLTGEYGVSLLILLGIINFYVVIVMAIKRFHDLGLPGLSIFLLLIPIINILVFLQLLAIKGNVGKNKYGEDPLKKEEGSLKKSKRAERDIGRTLIIFLILASLIISLAFSVGLSLPQEPDKKFVPQVKKNTEYQIDADQMRNDPLNLFNDGPPVMVEGGTENDPLDLFNDEEEEALGLR